MNYRSQLRRRLLASSLLSTGLLSLTGCGLSAALQREPDHVYSTTTPQMIEQEAAEASRPVEARYPEQARLFPHSYRSANGLKFRPVSLLTASAGFDETEADGEEGVISLGRPQTAVPVSLSFYFPDLCGIPLLAALSLGTSLTAWSLRMPRLKLSRRFWDF